MLLIMENFPEKMGWMIPKTTHATAMVRLAFPSSFKVSFSNTSKFYIVKGQPVTFH